MAQLGRGGFAAGVGAAAIASCLAGCAGVVAPTTRTAVDSSLATLAEPQNRRTIEEILRSDEITRATQGLTHAVVQALVSGDGQLTDARLAQLASDFARDVAPALGSTLDDVVLPRVQAAVAAGVRTSLDETLSDQNRRRVAGFSAEVAQRTVAAVAPQVEASISHGITSAVERVLQHDLSPAIGQALADNTPALAAATRALTAAALAGVNDAMAGPFGDMYRKERQATIAQVQAAEAQQQRALVDEVERQLEQSRRWFETLLLVVAAVGVALLGVGVLLWRVLAEQRRLRPGPG